MAVATQTMTDEQRKSVAIEYLKAFDRGGQTSDGSSILDLFADDAQVYFPSGASPRARSRSASCSATSAAPSRGSSTTSPSSTGSSPARTCWCARGPATASTATARGARACRSGARPVVRRVRDPGLPDPAGVHLPGPRLRRAGHRPLPWLDGEAGAEHASADQVIASADQVIGASADQVIEAWSADEMMTVAAARHLADGEVCFVGIGMPSLAANLARRTHAPRLVLVYESGTIGSKPQVVPLSIGDGELAETADAVVSVPEIFNYWLQPGRIDVGFLGAPSSTGAATSTPRSSGRTRRPGPAPGPGAPEIARSSGRVVGRAPGARTFVERVGFRTSLGERVATVITDIGVLGRDPERGRAGAHRGPPGPHRRGGAAATGWDPRPPRRGRDRPAHRGGAGRPARPGGRRGRGMTPFTRRSAAAWCSGPARSPAAPGAGRSGRRAGPAAGRRPPRPTGARPAATGWSGTSSPWSSTSRGGRSRGPGLVKELQPDALLAVGADRRSGFGKASPSTTARRWWRCHHLLRLGDDHIWG